MLFLTPCCEDKLANDARPTWPSPIFSCVPVVLGWADRRCKSQSRPYLPIFLAALGQQAIHRFGRSRRKRTEKGSSEVKQTRTIKQRHKDQSPFDSVWGVPSAITKVPLDGPPCMWPTSLSSSYAPFCSYLHVDAEKDPIQHHKISMGPLLKLALIL